MLVPFFAIKIRIDWNERPECFEVNLRIEYPGKKGGSREMAFSPAPTQVI